MRLSLGDVLSTTANVLIAGLPIFFLAALVCTSPAIVLEIWLAGWRFEHFREVLQGYEIYGYADEDELVRWSVLALGGSSLVGAFAIAATQAGALYTVVERMAGRTPAFGMVLRNAVFRMPAAIGAMIIVSCAVLFTGSCFGVPAIICAALFAFAVPAAVIEELSPFKAIGRSVDLTKDNRAMILGLFVAIVALFSAVRFGLRVAFGAPPLFAFMVEDVTESTPAWGYHVATSLTIVLEAMLLAVLSGVMYAKLRQRDGLDIDALADVFA